MTEAPTPLIEVSNGGPFMYKNLKPHKTFKEQSDILKNRGMVFISDNESIDFLSHVNYYRISGYLLPFIYYENGEQKYSTSLCQIKSIYNADASIRILLSSIIERIEIHLRTQISYYYSQQYGPDGYSDANNFNQRHNHIYFQSLLNKCINDNSKSPVVQHHINKYGGKFPLWVIIDYFTLGMLSHFYTDMKNPDKTYLSMNLYSVNYQTLSSWLRCITDLRNRCAHYSRLYYWQFPAIPKMPQQEKYKADRTLFSQLLMLKYMYPGDWNKDFLNPLRKLIRLNKAYINREHIGFPYKWYSILKK